jgi:acid phosphatase class B
VFSLVTVGRLGVAFDYDDTLVFSSPAYAKAFTSGVQPFSPGFWEIVNKSYDLEKPKMVSNALAWAFRILGFKITILSARPGYAGEGLKKEWRRLSNNFVFAGNAINKHQYLKDGHYVLYFGDGDSDMLEGRKARVLTVRVRRSPLSAYKDDYNPGSQRELVLPFSEY